MQKIFIPCIIPMCKLLYKKFGVLSRQYEDFFAFYEKTLPHGRVNFMHGEMPIL